MKGDLSITEIAEMMNYAIEKGWECFIKWECECCGDRVTCNTPNSVFTEGYLHEDCGHTSFPDKFGLMVMKSIGGENQHVKEKI